MFTYLRVSLLFSLAFAAHLGAQTVTLVSGNGQMVYEQFLTQVPMVIQAKDASGHPVSGLAVTWSITQGIGTLNSAAPMTDANGQATSFFLATTLPPGFSFDSEKVTATTSFGSVNFFVTTVQSRTSSGGNAIPPSVLLDQPPFENRNITAASGSTVPDAVVVRVFDQNGIQGGPVPNVGIRILNYPDQTLTPPAACNAPQGLALTNNNGAATCDLVITGPPGPAAFVVLVGEFQTTPRVALQITPGVSCSYALNASNLSVGANGGPGTVNVVTASGCGWSAFSNASWITINSGANASGNGSVSFTVAANSGNARQGTLSIAGLTFTVNQSAGAFSGLAITTPGPALNVGTVGLAYSATISATGGQQPYSWSSTGTLPPGLTLNASTGVISGTPSNPATFGFNITVKDNAGNQQSQNFTITINSSGGGGSSGFSITNSGFPNSVLNQAYPQQLLTTSGACSTPFFPSPIFSVSAGKLPDGLAIVRGQPDSIAGTPTTLGQFNFTLSARDACAATASANFTITITQTPTSQQMSVSPAPLAFTVQFESTAAPVDQTINIGANTGVLNFSAVLTTSSGGNWLVAKSAPNGTTPGSITVGIANFSNLAVGVYAGAVTISSQAANSPVVVQVSLTVTSGATSLTVTPTFFIVNQMASNNPTPARLNIAVTSGSQSSVHFGVSAQTNTGGAWLALTATQGDTPSVVVGIVNGAGLAPGPYSGSITISPAGGVSQTVTVTLNVLPPAGITSSASSLSFTYQQGAASPPTQTLLLSSNTGSALNLSIFTTTPSDGNWLFVDRPNGLTPFNVVVSVNPVGLLPGPHNGTITFTASDTSVAPLMVTVTLVVSQDKPVIAAVVNAASFAPGPISPGELITIFGTNIGPLIPAGLQLNASGKVDTLLGGTQVFINGVLAPMVFTSSGQVSAIVPYATPTLGAIFVQVQFQGLRSDVFVVRLIESAPGVFMADSTGQGAILNQDQTPNSTQNGALPNTIVSIFATGEGQTDPAGVDGMINGISPPTPRLKVTVQIDGLTADVSYAGGAPGLTAGVLQVNAKVPAGVHRGIPVPVVITVGTASSQTGVTLAIRP